MSSPPPENFVPSAKCADGYFRPVDIAKEITLNLDGVTRLLKQLHLPPLQHGARAPDPTEPCVVFLTYEDGIRITHMREGGRISPHNVHYALDPSWFTFDPATRAPVTDGTFPVREDDGGDGGRPRRPLYLLHGISFDRHGHAATHWTYDPPRLVTYLVQCFSYARTVQYRDDGVVLERHADTPLCSSAKLEVLTSDKLHTRILLACKQVGFPATLAFVYKPVVQHETIAELAVQVHTLEATAGDDMKAMVRERTLEWIDGNPSLRRLVVKPSGPSFQQSRGVSFHDRGAREEIVAAILALVPELGANDSVLVDEFLEPMPPRQVVNAREAALVTALRGKQPSRSKKLMSVEDHLHISKIVSPGLSHRLRVVVQRTLDDRCRVVSIICGVGDISKPIGGCNTITRTFDQFCDTWGISKGEPRAEVYNAVCVEGERTLQAIIDAEAKMTPEERGAEQAQTDTIGLDIILSMRHGVIVPVVIEVNDYDSTSQAQELEYCVPRLHGSVVSTWLTTAVARSIRYMMRGKRTLAVCGSWPEVRRAAYAATAFGARLLVVAPNKQCVEHSAAAEALAGADPDGSGDDAAGAGAAAHAAIVVEQLSCDDVEGSVAAVSAAVEAHVRGRAAGAAAASERPFDGVVGFCQTLGPVVRRLCDTYKVEPVACACSGIAAYQQAMVDSAKEPMWHTVNPPLLVLKHCVVRSAADVEAAVEAIGVPMSVRPDVAVGEIGARLAFRKDAAAAMVKEQLAVQAARRQEAKFAVGGAVLLSAYKDGSLHDVYVVVHRGELVAGFMADVGPPNLPQCDGPTAYRLPTREDADTESTMVNTVHYVLGQMGVGHGVYRCRMQLRDTLPNMVSLDACAGGDFMSDWCFRVFGWSLCEAAMALACGIRPAIPKKRWVRTHLIGAVLYESRHERCTDRAGMEYIEKLEEHDVLAMWPLERATMGDGEAAVPGHEEPVCVVACFGDSRDGAEASLRTALDVLAVDGAGEPGETVWFVSNM